MTSKQENVDLNRNAESDNEYCQSDFHAVFDEMVCLHATVRDGYGVQDGRNGKNPG